MSDFKKKTVPSLTDGQAGYSVVIPTITARHHREMIMLQAANEIKAGKESLEEAEEAFAAATKELESDQGLIDALKEAEADHAFIASKIADYADTEKVVGELGRKLEKTKSVLEKDIAKVKNHFGNMPALEIGELEITYLLIGKEIIGEPWAVMACCGLGPEDWVDIDYEDYAELCKELLRRNPRFFKIRHLKTMAEK